MMRTRYLLWHRGVLWLCLLLALPAANVNADAVQEAGPTSATVAESAPGHGIVCANWWRTTFGNRTRIIQVTTVAVIVGVFILQWRRT